MMVEEEELLVKVTSEGIDVIENAVAFLRQAHPGILERNPELLFEYEQILDSVGTLFELPHEEQINAIHRLKSCLSKVRFILFSMTPKHLEEQSKTVH